MALLDLKTNLRSLKYGNDRPGSGNSGQPFVTFPLPETRTTDPFDFNDYYNNNKYNIDFPVRGGSFGAIGLDNSFIGPQLPGSEAVTTKIALDSTRKTWANAVDMVRIGKFLKSEPRGTLFILKQQALQFSNPNIQVARENNLETTRIYNPASTLAQVGEMGSGTHLNRHGATVSETLEPNKTSLSTYEWIANERNNPLKQVTYVASNGLIGTGATFNRLVALNNTKRLNTEKPTTFGISENSNQLFSYIGGPTGQAGVAGGTTIIQKAGDSVDLKARLADLPKTLQAPYYIVKGTDTVETAYNPKEFRTTPAPNSYQYVAAYSESRLISSPDKLIASNLATDSVKQQSDTTPGTTNIANFSYTYNYEMLANEESSKNNPSIKEDFRRKIKSKVPAAKDKLLSVAGYNGNSDIATRYGIGNPGSPQIKRVDYTAPSSDIAKDKINALDVSKVDTVAKDLINFRIDTIEDDPRAIIFRAFLTGISDSHTADFNPFKYIGRGENFYVYNGFSRQVSFNFKVAAQTRDEMKPIYRKLNYLVSQLYPDYNTDTPGAVGTAGTAGEGFMRAPLVKLTIGDYISVQPGFFTSLAITIPEDSPWEINFTNSDTMYQLPHVLDVSCQFTPIHDFLPRRSRPNSITPLITPNVQGNNFGIGG